MATGQVESTQRRIGPKPFLQIQMGVELDACPRSVLWPGSKCHGSLQYLEKASL